LTRSARIVNTPQVQRTRAVLGFVVGLACGPGGVDTTSTGSSTSDTTEPDATSTSSTSSTSSGVPTSGEPSTGEPVCIDFYMEGYDPDEELTPPLFTCGLPELCPGANGKPLVFTGDNPVTTADIERGRCMVAAMRDRTPGLFRFTVQPILGYDTTTIEILGETILVRRHSLSDFNEDYSEGGYQLFAPELYAPCVDSTATLVLKCLTEGYAKACVSEPLMCPN
jgi:hypothetical protein